MFTLKCNILNLLNVYSTYNKKVKTIDYINKK